MALNKIKNNASWGESASSLNSNFESIEADLTKVKNATTRCKGYFISGDELKTAYPSAHVGDYAYIGTAYPFYIWKWNGSSWGNTGNTGGDQDVNLENYYNKTETDAKLSELGSKTNNIVIPTATDGVYYNTKTFAKENSQYTHCYEVTITSEKRLYINFNVQYESDVYTNIIFFNDRNEVIFSEKSSDVWKVYRLEGIYKVAISCKKSEKISFFFDLSPEDRGVEKLLSNRFSVPMSGTMYGYYNLNKPEALIESTSARHFKLDVSKYTYLELQFEEDINDTVEGGLLYDEKGGISVKINAHKDWRTYDLTNISYVYIASRKIENVNAIFHSDTYYRDTQEKIERLNKDRIVPNLAVSEKLDFSIKGRIYDGVLDTNQSNWVTSDFIEICDFGHTVSGYTYKESEYLFYYSEASEDAYISSVSETLPTMNGNFSAYNFYVRTNNVPANAKYFRVTSYKEDIGGDIVKNISRIKPKTDIDYSYGDNLMEIQDDSGRKIAAIDKDGLFVNGFINVLNKGVKEGLLDSYIDIVNNTVTINNLISKYSTRGAVLYFPKGIYSVATGGITMRSNVSVIGAGKNLTIFKVRHSVVSSTGALFGYDNNALPLRNVQYSDFCIDMSEYILAKYRLWNVNQKGIYCQYIEDSVFKNIVVKDSPATGIGIDYMKNVEIKDNVLLNCGKYWGSKEVYHEGVGGCAGLGIGTGGYDDENCVISGNIAIGCGQFGIFIENQGEAFGSSANKKAKGYIITNNICRLNRRSGIGIRGGNNVVVSDNVCYNNYGSGIFLELNINNVLVVNNMVASNGVSEAESGEKDFIVIPEQGGIRLENNMSCNGLTIKGNDIRDNIGSGVEFMMKQVNNTTISNNNMSGNTKSQVNVSTSSNRLNISHNNISGDIVISGKHIDMIYDNYCFGEEICDDAIFEGVNNYNKLSNV